MNGESGSAANRCVNCSVLYDEVGNNGKRSKVEEIFVGENTWSGRGSNESGHMVAEKVGSMLSKIFKLNYWIPDGEDGDEEKFNPDDLSVCRQCSDGLRELWKVYNDFIRLGEQNSYLLKRVAKLDESIERQCKPSNGVGSFIQLRSDIFDDDSESTNHETEEVLSITPVSEPRIRGKIPVRVQELPEPLMPTRAERNILPSPEVDFVVGDDDEDDNFVDPDEELWRRLTVTPEIHCDQPEAVAGEQMDSASNTLAAEVHNNELQDLNPTCKAVSYSLFSSYRPHPEATQKQVEFSGNKNGSKKSNRRKSSVITRECTDAIIFEPGSQQDKSHLLFSPPAALKPRILSRKRKLPTQNISDANELTFEVIGEVQTVQVLQTLESADYVAPPKEKLQKVTARGKLKKNKGKRKRSKKKIKRSKAGPGIASSKPGKGSTADDQNNAETTSSQKSEENSSEKSKERIPAVSVPKLHENERDLTKLPDNHSPIETTATEFTKKPATTTKSSKSKSPVSPLNLTKTVSEENTARDETLPSVKVFNTVPEGQLDTEPIEGPLNYSSHTSVVEEKTDRVVKPEDRQSNDSLPIARHENSRTSAADCTQKRTEESGNSTLSEENLTITNRSSSKITKTKITKPDFKQRKDIVLSSSDLINTKLKKKKKKLNSSMSDGNLHKRHRLRKLRVPYPCWYCSMDFLTAPDVIEHTKKVHNVPSKSIMCMQCAKVCNSPQSFKYHAKTCLPPRKPSKNQISSSSGAAHKIKCPLCFKLFLKKSFPIHLKVTHSDDRPFPCDTCDYKAKTPYRMKIHRQKVHNIVHTTRVHKPVQNAATHVKLTTEDLELSNALQSERPISNNNSASVKYATKTGVSRDRPFPCELCSYKGLSDAGLQAHKKKNHHAVKCTVCDSMFIDKYILQEHMRTKHDDQGLTYRKKLRSRYPEWVISSRDSETSNSESFGNPGNTDSMPSLETNRNASMIHNEGSYTGVLTPLKTAKNPFNLGPALNNFEVFGNLSPAILDNPHVNKNVTPKKLAKLGSSKEAHAKKTQEVPEISLNEPIDLSTPSHQHQPCEYLKSPQPKHSKYFEATCKATVGSEDTTQKQFICKDCDMSFPSKYRMIKHKMVEHGFTKTATFFCDRCGKGFFTEESRRVHQDTIHGLEKAFVCQFCGKEFVKTSTLKNHMIHIHPNETKPYSCNRCGISFEDVSNLRDHTYSCEPEQSQPSSSGSAAVGESSSSSASNVASAY